MSRNSKIILIIVISILLLASLFVGKYALNHDEPVHDDVHFHAAFKVYIQDKQEDFGQFKYMHLEPCTLDEKEEEGLVDIKDKVHLHNNIGEVVHIHAPGITWRDLFVSLEREDLFEEDVDFYKNGGKVVNLLDEEIQEYDSVLFMIDSNTDNLSELYTTKQAMLEAEAKLEDCGK